MSEKRSVGISLCASVLPVAAVGLVGSLLTDTRSKWYLSLAKPILQPPDWAFPVAWSLVYLCAALALYLPLRRGDFLSKSNVCLLILCGLMDIIWSAVFFRLHALIWSCAVLLVLEGVLFAAIQQLFPRQRVSGTLLLPHLLWGLYALLLNLSLLGRNLNL